MKRCPNCSRTYRNSHSFCLDDGSLLLELSVFPKATYMPIILLSVATFGATFGATIWWLQQKQTNSQIDNRTPLANSVSSVPANQSSTISSESVKASSAVGPSEVVQQPTPRTMVDVLVKYFSSAKVHDYPMPNEPIVLKVENQRFNEITNSKGLATFSNVPCGKQAKLTFTGEPSRSFSRSLKCENQTVIWRYYFDSYAEFGSLAIKQVK